MFMSLPFPLGRNSEREEKKEPHDGEGNPVPKEQNLNTRFRSHAASGRLTNQRLHSTAQTCL